MATKTFKGKEARRRVLGGSKEFRDNVAPSYGPQGGNAAILKLGSVPTITHDGATIADAVNLPHIDDDTLGYRVGSEALKGAAKKLTKIVGNGRTAGVILTHSIQSGINELLDKGHNAQDVRKGIEIAKNEVIDALETLNDPIDEQSDRVMEVATVAANGDEEIGELIADTIKKIGKDGVILVEAGVSLKLEPEIVEGFVIDRGWINPVFVTDAKTQEAVYDDPAILIKDGKISDNEELIQVIGGLKQSGRKNIIIIADEVERGVLVFLLDNMVKNIFNCVVINPPSYGQLRKDILQDIATLTGAVVVSDESNITFDSTGIEAAGSARKIIVGREETTIIDGGGDASKIEERIKLIKKQIEDSRTPYERDIYTRRSGALGGKIAIIRVGGVTETEISERKDRVDDSAASTKAALMEGVVAGGAITLVNLARFIQVNTYKSPLLVRLFSSRFKSEHSINAGKKVLRDAMVEPFLQLTKNAGLDGKKLLRKVQSAPVGYGFNVSSPESGLIDMKSAGIIDPTPVVREVIRTAVSMAATLGTMETLIVELPEKESQQESEY